MVPKCHPANGASYTTSSDQIYISFSLDRKLLQNFTSGDDNSSHLELLLMNKVLTECLGSLTMAFLAPKENSSIKLKCGSQPSINGSSKFQRNSATSPNRCNKRRKVCKSSRENNQNGPLHSQNLEINGYRWDSDADSDVGGGRQSPDENVDITSSDRKSRNCIDTSNYSISGMHSAPQIPTKLLEFASVQHVVSDLAAAAARDNNNSSPLNLSSKTLNAKNLDMSSSAATHPQMPISSACVVPSVTILREMKKITASEENVFEIENSGSGCNAASVVTDDGAESSSDSDYTCQNDDDTGALTSGQLLEEDDDDSVLDVSHENHSLLSPSMLTNASENITPSKLNKSVLTVQNDELKGIAVVTPAAAPGGPMFHGGNGGLMDGSCNNLKLSQSLNELILEGIYGCGPSQSGGGRGGANRSSGQRDHDRKSSNGAAVKSTAAASLKDDLITTSRLLSTAAAAFLPKSCSSVSLVSSSSTPSTSSKSGTTTSPPTLKCNSAALPTTTTTSINNNNILLPLNQSSKLSPPSSSPSSSSSTSSVGTSQSASSNQSGGTPRRGQKSLVCEFGCGYETPDATLLKSHHVSHSNDRPYQCSYCGHAFKRNHTLLRHIRQVHKIDTTSATGEAVFSVASMVTPQQSVTTLDMKSAAAASGLCATVEPPSTPVSSTTNSTSSPGRVKRESAVNASALLKASANEECSKMEGGSLLSRGLKLNSGSPSQKRMQPTAIREDAYDDEGSELCIDDDMEQPMDLAFGAGCSVAVDEDSEMVLPGSEDGSFMDLKPVFNLGSKACSVLNMSGGSTHSSSGTNKSSTNNSATTAVKLTAASQPSLNLVMSM